MDKYLWQPSKERIQKSILEEFSKFIDFKYKHDFKELWKWSVSEPEVFWSKFWDFSKIIGDKGEIIIEKNNIFNKNKFFPDSKLNYSENILKKKNQRCSN